MVERKAPARKKAAPKADPPEPTADETPKVETVTQPAPPDHPGFIGDATDPTPNENYTLSGVIADLPVPEHDR